MTRVRPIKSAAHSSGVGAPAKCHQEVLIQGSIEHPAMASPKWETLMTVGYSKELGALTFLPPRTPEARVSLPQPDDATTGQSCFVQAPDRNTGHRHWGHSHDGVPIWRTVQPAHLGLSDVQVGQCVHDLECLDGHRDDATDEINDVTRLLVLT